MPVEHTEARSEQALRILDSLGMAEGIADRLLSVAGQMRDADRRSLDVRPKMGGPPSASDETLNKVIEAEQQELRARYRALEQDLHRSMKQVTSAVQKLAPQAVLPHEPGEILNLRIALGAYWGVHLPKREVMVMA